MKVMLYPFLTLLFSPFYSQGQMQNNGNLRMHLGSEVGLFGDFTNNGSFTNNLGTLHAVGSDLQTMDGNNLIHTNNFTINKSDNSLLISNRLQVAGILTFTSGLINTDRANIATQFVDFLDGSMYTGESNTSHVDGVIRKTGNDAFVFPTGDNSFLRTIGISAPSAATDGFTAFYTEDNPDALYSRDSLDTNLDHVSECEFWILNRTGGSSDVEVTLSWASNSCGVNVMCDLLVSRWDGTKWTSEGNGGVTGTPLSGTLVSGTICSYPASVSSFSPFTLGSISNVNPLPITLISFDADVCENLVCLTWQTASEINNDFFTVSRSADVSSWTDFEDISGAGDSHSILNYQTIDHSPFAGLSYYRLKQTDFDGAFEYSSIKSIYLETPVKQGLTIYPNPAADNITIKGLPSQFYMLKIYSSIGQEVTNLAKITGITEPNLQLDISLLIPGIYHVRADNHYGSFIKL